MVREAGRSENLALASDQHLVRVSLLHNRAEDVTQGESAASPGLSSSSIKPLMTQKGHGRVVPYGLI